ncbi:histone deacetylase [Chloropicon primus]|uniref:Histone deacetylase n=1 Tax=Chloropicon primus TaxID=1764295 RepID=A0A5B8MQX2_9CHLO|nr:histone deacetylase [Chloropicon primus]UPR01975.1 histone deacetylase [Chloropicon primus]|mmetsp:Transcript_1472/g.4240  ORF Transcript_1472/g.4240 Transcript_1472/m.4240 type:complete len:360 (-) Transcript_1472:475-1554(-)|eukprot:QDZ22751.1 histone deacetylase [Chloropicon primus]
MIAGGLLRRAHPLVGLVRGSKTRASSQYTTRSSRSPSAIPLVYHELYSGTELPAGHRFPMPVFRRIYQKLMELNSIGRVDLQVHEPELCEASLREKLSLVHTEEYIHKFMLGDLDAKEIRRMGLPWSPSLVKRTLSELAGTMMAADLALSSPSGVALSCAGGTHHAHKDFGSGFCIFNDMGVTALSLLQEEKVARVLIVDLDVHQGDGTAAIFGGSGDGEAEKYERSVFTFSMHCQDNFPARKQESSMDIGLPRGVGDAVYLPTLASNLTDVVSRYQPDLVLYDAGVDVHAEDQLGYLQLTTEGIYRRDMIVLDTCAAFGVPVAGYVGGGYAEDLDELAWRHCQLHLAAHDLNNVGASP